MEELCSHLHREAQARTGLPLIEGFWEGPGLLRDFVDSIIKHISSRIDGGEGLAGVDYTREARSEAVVQISFGEYALGLVPKEKADEVQKAHQRLMGGGGCLGRIS